MTTPPTAPTSSACARPGGCADEAGGGEQALAQCRQAVADGDPYALLLLDRMMPSMDGLEVLAELKTDRTLAAAKRFDLAEAPAMLGRVQAEAERATAELQALLDADAGELPVPANSEQV